MAASQSALEQSGLEDKNFEQQIEEAIRQAFEGPPNDDGTSPPPPSFSPPGRGGPMLPGGGFRQF